MSKDTIKKTKKGKVEKRQSIGYAFIGPAAFAMIAMIIYPMAYGLYISFFNTNLVTKWKFVGLRYYIQAFTNSEFYSSVLLTFKFMILVCNRALPAWIYLSFPSEYGILKGGPFSG